MWLQFTHPVPYLLTEYLLYMCRCSAYTNTSKHQGQGLSTLGNVAVYKAYGRKKITLAAINTSKGSDLECTLTRNLCVLKIQYEIGL